MIRNRLKIQENWIDRTIAYVAPQAAARRRRARAMLAMTGGYVGGSKSRRSLSGWNVSGGDADSDQIPDLPILRERSRDLLRNAPLAKGAINTVCTNVVGPGLRLFPKIDREILGLTPEQAATWERSTRRQFNLWANSKNCDVRRMMNFYDIQELTFRSMLESGDVFTHLPMAERSRWPFRLMINTIESDRVCNANDRMDSQNLVQGVEKNANGQPIAYHVAQFHPGNSLYPESEKKWSRVQVFGATTGRRNIIHMMQHLRPGQTRGVPYLAPVIEPLKQLVRYSEAELMAAVVSGLFTVFIETDSGDGELSSTYTADETGQQSGDNDMKLGNGLMVGLAPGEKVSSANPGRPNTAFDPFVMAVLRQIGTALEIPFEILIKHFTASYSAARAALLEAWKFFKARRQFFARNYCDPVYEAWMEDAAALGIIDAPGFFDDPLVRAAWLRCMWVGPAKGMINESQEMDAAQKRLDSNLTTYEQETIELNGGDFEMNMEQRAKENRIIRETGGAASTAPAPAENEPEQDPDQPEGPDRS